MISFSTRTATTAALALGVLAFLQLMVVFIVLLRHPETTALPAPEKPAAMSAAMSAATPKSMSAMAKKSRTGPGSAVAGVEDAPTMDAEEATTLPGALGDVDKGAFPQLPTEVDILVKRALAARAKGDMSGTLAGLRDAQKLYPDDPKIIAEFATTYEQMGLVDKALAQWKRVFDAGEKAGDLYGVAAEKLKNGITPRETPGNRDQEGLQEGSTFGLVDLQKNYESAKDEAERVTLRAGIKIRPNATVVPSKLNIQVMFYDLVNNTDVEPTDAKVTSEWVTTPVNWQDDGVEVLKVLYLAKPTASGGKNAQEKKFLGYIMRVYYENELQDVYADPVQLLKYFPPQLTLQKEIPQ